MPRPLTSPAPAPQFHTSQLELGGLYPLALGSWLLTIAALMTLGLDFAIDAPMARQLGCLTLVIGLPMWCGAFTAQLLARRAAQRQQLLASVIAVCAITFAGTVTLGTHFLIDASSPLQSVQTLVQLRGGRLFAWWMATLASVVILPTGTLWCSLRNVS